MVEVDLGCEFKLLGSHSGASFRLRRAGGNGSNCLGTIDSTNSLNHFFLRLGWGIEGEGDARLQDIDISGVERENILCAGCLEDVGIANERSKPDDVISIQWSLCTKTKIKSWAL